MYPNVISYNPYGWYYLIHHPWKIFSQAFRNIKYAFQRATKGYADCDWWNMDNWFVNVLPSMLRTLADKGQSYPGRGAGETPEKWHDWLYEVADELEQSTEEYNDSQNEYHKPFMDILFKPYADRTPEEKEIEKKYFERSTELYKIAEEKAIDVFKKIGEEFFALWD